MEKIYNENDNGEVVYNYLRVLFDFLFGFLLTMIVIQLISGLIIDKFKELRDNEDKIREHISQFCISCGRSADEVETVTKEPFEINIQSYHNLWFYLIYIGYLNTKPVIDHTGIESYIYKHYLKESFEWMPYTL